MDRGVTDPRLSFPVKHGRPDRLRNGGCCYDDLDLDAILRKRDEDLTWGDFKTLFTISRCVGTPQELAHFLPYAFRYVLADEQEGHECTSEVLHFISHEAEFLRSNSLEESCRQAVQAWLEHWTKSFEVYSESWSCTKCHHDHRVHHVSQADIVTDVLDHLLQYKTHADWVEALVKNWAKDESPLASAWFLEYMGRIASAIRDHDSGEHLKTWERFAGPMFGSELAKFQPAVEELKNLSGGQLPDNPLAQVQSAIKNLFTDRDIPAEQSPTIMGLLRDGGLLKAKLDSVLASPWSQTVPAGYWNELTRTLNLAPEPGKDCCL